ncbi:hypothetical protein [Priestia megaterium]
MEGKAKTPAKKAESEKPCTEIKIGVPSDPYELMYLIYSSLD